MFTDHFDNRDSITCEIDGFTATATIYRDDSNEAPWDREDGHGIVRGWVALSDKKAGELVLCRDGRDARFYDFAAVVKTARREGWGSTGDEHLRRGAKAAAAARADYERLRAWCNDDWYYVGVAVTVSRHGIELTGRYDNALWGIESDAGEYLTETANELLGEALEQARAAVASLAA